MRFRKFAVLATAIAMAATTAACSSDSSSSSKYKTAGDTSFAAGSTMERIHKSGKIKIGVKFDQPGIGQMNPATNKPEGFDIEMGKIVAASLGIPADKITWVEAVSANRETFIQNGTVDMVIASYSITPERKEKISYAGPYYLTGQQLLVRKSDNSINGPTDLSGKKVCSVTGSDSLANIQKNYKGAKTVPFGTYTECVQQLVNGSVDAMTTDGAILLGYAARQPSKLKVVGSPFSEEKYGIGLKHDDSALRSFIDDTLQKAFQDGDWSKAFDATLGKSGDKAPAPPALERY
jgi:glutamate transport system substrate-binding protein